MYYKMNKASDFHLSRLGKKQQPRVQKKKTFNKGNMQMTENDKIKKELSDIMKSTYVNAAVISDYINMILEYEQLRYMNMKFVAVSLAFIDQYGKINMPSDDDDDDGDGDDVNHNFIDENLLKISSRIITITNQELWPRYKEELFRYIIILSNYIVKV